MWSGYAQMDHDRRSIERIRVTRIFSHLTNGTKMQHCIRCGASGHIAGDCQRVAASPPNADDAAGKRFAAVELGGTSIRVAIAVDAPDNIVARKKVCVRRYGSGARGGAGSGQLCVLFLPGFQWVG